MWIFLSTQNQSFSGVRSKFLILVVRVGAISCEQLKGKHYIFRVFRSGLQCESIACFYVAMNGSHYDAYLLNYDVLVSKRGRLKNFYEWSSKVWIK